jgi:bifunctional non-homologous end joining protein LigD
MLATLVDEPFDDKRWVFETKWDGFRLITEKRGDTVRLWSRNGIDVTTRYAVLLPALQKIQGSCVIDGELCALDAHGRSHFQLLQKKSAYTRYLLHSTNSARHDTIRLLGSRAFARLLINKAVG